MGRLGPRSHTGLDRLARSLLLAKGYIFSSRRHPGRSSIFRDRGVSRTQSTRRRGNLYGYNLVKFAFVCSSRVFYTSSDHRDRFSFPRATFSPLGATPVGRPFFEIGVL